MQQKWEVVRPERYVEGKYFGSLKAKVIDPGICSHCGTCSVCPVKGIRVEDRPIYFPNWEEDCIDCAACVRVCPRYNYVPLNGMGEYTEILAAKSKRFKGQDGAMATEYLISAIEKGVIDEAIFVGRDEEWRTTVHRVRDADQVNTLLTGTKYSFAAVLPEMIQSVREKNNVGVVGTPCMVSGIRQLQREIRLFAKRVKLVIGLFCTENFYWHQLSAFLAERGIDLSRGIKTDIKKGKFIVEYADGEKAEIPVKEFDPIIPSGCKVCQDFSAVESDVSVGSVGSKAGFSTLIIRQEVAKDLLEFMKEQGTVEVIEEVKMKIIEKLIHHKIEIHPYPPRKVEH
jgi:coenzyme F420 hydrogenase subunit beta